MWFLTRKPSDPSFNDHLIRSQTTIFSFESVFDDMSFLLTDEEQHQEQEAQEDALRNQNPWRWFAYECAPMQFVAVSVPPQTQIISILPNHFLCAQMIFPPQEQKTEEKPEPFAKLCIYVRRSNDLCDVPSSTELKEGRFRDLFTAACALIDGWFYVAGGFLANSSSSAEEKLPTPLNSAEALNLNSLMWEWERLPSMLKPCAKSEGIAYRKRFFVIGDGNHGHSAQIYCPAAKKWILVTQFIPQEANGYTVGSADGCMFLLTWSGYLGIKLWQFVDLSLAAARWELLYFYSPYEVEKVRIYENRVKLVTIGKGVFIMVGVNRRFCWVDGVCAWPVLPPPFFCPSESQRVYRGECVRGFRKIDNYLSWRQIPVYRLGRRR